MEPTTFGRGSRADPLYGDRLIGRRDRLKLAALVAVVFACGFVVGGYLFSESQQRSFLAVHDCQERCLKANELAGLLTSAGILRADALLPRVELESDECIAVRHPRPQANIHILLLPKFDITDIGSLPPGGSDYVQACLAMIGEIARKYDTSDYRVVTYGGGLQQVRYLHFHFLAT